MDRVIEITVVGAIVLVAMIYLVRQLMKRLRGRSCGGGSCACGPSKAENKAATLTVSGRPVSHS